MLSSPLRSVLAALALLPSLACRQVTCSQDADCGVDGYRCQIKSGDTVGQCCRSDRPCSDEPSGPPKTCSLFAWQAGEKAMDRFGQSVSISAGQILVGASGGNAGTGTAYLYRIDKPDSPNGSLAPDSEFSSSLSKIAVSGSGLGGYVALFKNQAYLTTSQRLYAMEQSGAAGAATWNHRWAQPIDFPTALTVVDDTQVAVAGTRAGSSTVLVLRSSDGGQCREIRPLELPTTASYGSALSFRDGYLFVGAPSAAVGEPGRVFGTTWASCGAALDPPLLVSKSDQPSFGQSLAAGSHRLVVCSPESSDVPLFYDYEINSGIVGNEQTGPVGARNTGTKTIPGAALALDGDLLVVGSPDSQAALGGVVSIYQRMDGRWDLRLSTESTPPGALAGVSLGGLGEAVAVADGFVVMAAPQSRVEGQAEAGAVLVYRCQ